MTMNEFFLSKISSKETTTKKLKTKKKYKN